MLPVAPAAVPAGGTDRSRAGDGRAPGDGSGCPRPPGRAGAEGALVGTPRQSVFGAGSLRLPLPAVALMSRTLVVLALAATCTGTALAARAGTPQGEPLAGTWSGVIGGQPGLVTRQHIQIVVNARESGGSWRLSGSCYGSLKLASISGGYHHYLRTAAPGATCAGGDVDCLKPDGLLLEDAVTSHLGGRWDANGTLQRLRPA